MVLVGVCLLSAALFAAGNSLQHLGANNLGGDDLPPLKIVVRLFQSKTWLLGSAIALCAFGTHILALGLGEVGVVQPLLLVGVIMAIAFRPLLDGARAHIVEIGAAALAVGGLALYIRAGAIYDSEPVDPPGNAAIFAAIAVAVVTVLVLVARRLGFDLAVTFALCAGILTGTGAGLIKEILSGDTPTEHLLGWVFPVAVALELTGTFFNQRAYHAGPLTRSMPVVNVVSVLMGGMFGIFVFGELPRLGAVPATLQVIGMALAAFGLVVLARRQAEPPVVLAGHDPDLDGDHASSVS